MRKPIISARLWTTWSAQRGSSMHHARRSATRSRFSTSARARTPPFEDSIPPSKRATTDLLRTDDKPVSGSVGQPLGVEAAIGAMEAGQVENAEKRRQVELALEQARYEV